MTIRGYLNCTIDGNVPFGSHQAAPLNEAFATIHQFLNGPIGSSLGIIRVAANYGNTGLQLYALNANSNGHGMDYWDGPKPAGDNAWALFKFTKAQPLPFYMLFQFAGANGNGFGASPGNPGIHQGTPYYASTTDGAIGVAVSLMSDGSNPWGGTLRNDGTDTKSDPVWISGSINFPRANEYDGANATHREATMILVSNTGLYNNETIANIADHQHIFHVFADSSNFMFALEYKEGPTQPVFFYFGAYTPINKRVILTDKLAIPYVAIMQSNASGNDASGQDPIVTGFSNPAPPGNVLPPGTPNIYGNRTLSVDTVYNNASMAGGVISPIDGQVHQAFIDSNSLFSDFFLNSNASFQRTQFGNESMPWDVFYPAVGMIDDLYIGLNQFTNPGSFLYRAQYGMLGTINFFGTCYGLKHGTLLSGKNYMVFGSSVRSSVKIVLPWDGITIPKTWGSRIGAIM